MVQSAILSGYNLRHDMRDTRGRYCVFILILGMCSDVDPLDKVITNAFTQKKNASQTVSVLRPYLSLCSSGPWDDFVAGKLLFLCPSFLFCLLFVG